MYDCSVDVKAFHNQEVTLPESEQTNMRKRRNSNRERLKNNLEENEKPTPYEHVSQGSYQMKTMLRDPDNDYDIDDGAYFKKSTLFGSKGAEMTSLQARQMVRDAMDDGRFKKPPEVRGNCVRVHYSAGYHVDIPVYRRIETNDETHFELAASSGWKRSDARDVTEWYEVKRKASDDPIQFRRLNRYLKMYAKSRHTWKPRILCGFGISVLLAEHCAIEVNREDRALYDTMKAIRDRLDDDSVIDHPVTPDETITSGDSDAKATYYKDRLTDALDRLEPLFDEDCDRETALKCWDKVFNTTFFIERYEEDEEASETKSALGAPAIASGALLGATSAAADAVSETGGGRNA